MDKEDIELVGMTSQEVGNFYLFLVAICHQTSPQGKPPLEGTIGGVRKKGWDYLSARFEEQVQVERDLLLPDRWATIGGREFADLFRDLELGERLTRPGERADLIRNLGKVMQDENWMWIEQLYESCAGRVRTGSPNLIESLSQFRAYSDPVHKKSSFFLALMRNHRLWTYSDPDRLGPPVDYHEVRGHLRIGTVKINDEDLRRKLLERLPVDAEEDVAIRSAVLDAIMLIAEVGSIKDPSRLHYLFWNVFRSCCTHETPHCLGCPPNCTLPSRYVPLSTTSGYRRCAFASVCASARASKRYYEHVFDTDFY